MLCASTVIPAVEANMIGNASVNCESVLDFFPKQVSFFIFWNMLFDCFQQYNKSVINIICQERGHIYG